MAEFSIKYGKTPDFCCLNLRSTSLGFFTGRKGYCVFILCCLCLFTSSPFLSLNAQVSDDFSDGNFTSAPVWTGDDSIFVINVSNQLQSNGFAQADTAFLSTSYNLSFSDTITWEFYVNLLFSPSDNNRASVFLVSDNADLQSPLNGYYIRIGENGSLDAIKLYRQSGISSTLILSGAAGLYPTNPAVRIKVVRDPSANWTIYSDSTGGTNYIQEGSVNDNSFSSSSFFGVWCKYTSSNSKNFIFDDFVISGSLYVDTFPPTITSLTVISATQLDLKFSEKVSVASAENEFNYSVNNGIGNPFSSIIDSSDSSMVHLVFSASFANGSTNIISVSGIQDTSGNSMIATNQSFNFFVVVPTAFKDVIITEIFADTNPQVGLPIAEFLEIYNKSNKTFDLAGWKFSDGSTTATLGSFILLPDSFLILCSPADTSDFANFGTTLGAASFPSLNNAGDNLTLRDSTTLLIDAVSYSDTWYQDAIKKNGGWSLELINPNNSCSGANNWIASNDPSGGTPGKINSVNDTTPDSTPPSLLSLTILSPSQIELTFSEIMDSASLANGTYIFDNGISVNSVLVAGNFSIVTLNLIPPIDTAIFYTLAVSNVTDCPGNLIGNNDSLQFVIGYQPNAGDIIINEIYADTNPQLGLPNAEYVELFNKTGKILDLGNCDFSGTTFPSGTIILPNQYLILCYAPFYSLLAPYGTVVPMNGWNGAFLINTGMNLLLSRAGQQIDKVFYDDSWYKNTIKDDGGWSLELINPNNPCSGADNWIASNDPSGGTPGKINSVNDTTPDSTPPSLSSVTIVSPSQIELSFSENMDSTSLANGTYLLDSGLTVTSLTIDAGIYSFVTLTINPAIDTAIVYTISVSNVWDCSGNLLGNNDSLQFVIGYLPEAGDVIINEIFADPTPQTGLPDAEFVELYNRSGKFLDLSNCLFSGASFPPGTAIAPNGFLILTGVSTSNLFAPYGTIAGMGSWSSTFLTNSGKDLILGFGPEVIDRVFYSDSWYNDVVKDDGGWSLERKNPLHPCSSSDNWTASVDTTGGTPGKVNSVFNISPDVQAPYVLSVKAESPYQVLITFSEGMDSTSLVTNYTIGNGISVINVQPLGPDFTSVLLDVSPALDSATVYSGNIFYVSDCSGNSISNTPFTFGIGVNAGSFEILINEIYADPDGSVSSIPEVEFVELYNKTPKVINLNNYKFSDGSTSATITNAVLMPNSYLIVCPASNLADYSPFGNAVGLTGFPSLNNAGDNLTLKDAAGTLIHEVIYSDDWYGDELKKDGGWTLELIDPENPCGEANNWRASNDASGGTPGKINSVNGSNPDVIAPKIISAFALNPLSVVLYFDETLDSLSAKNASYSINNGITVFAVLVLDKKTVQVNLGIALQTNIIYTITANGMSDCLGNTSAGTSAEFSFAEQGVAGDIIINEVLFNPRTGGSDFVEVYNHSSKVINLQNWEFANIDSDSISNRKIISSQPIVLFPEEYLVLTKDTDNIRREYPLGKPGRYKQVASLPNYNIDSGTVILINNLGIISDVFSYNNEMHFALLNDAKGVSLERIDFNRPSSDATNWHSAAESVGWATPGYQNSQYNPSEGDGSHVSVEPEIFSPDNDGFNDVVNINYKFDNPGYVATISIFDAKGRQIRALAKNTLLGIEGTFSWDGISDSREKARIGIYLIWFEAYDLSGKVLHFKKTCVLAGRMD